ncbi:MAG: glutamate racemase [Candidatus Cloacimonas sp. SDB]|nr:MAG: glutamate racemase [Candidatus Cloacimonas sp. SDB]
MKQPIGIFDSGVGGLTVFREIRKNFPYEDIIYFGDTARVPYGPKSRNTIVEYSVQNARFLTQYGAKIIVVACNTSSAVALEHLQKNFSIPVIGVIESGAEAAVKATCNNKIGVIGTDGTIRSNAYFNAISALFSKMEIHSRACPLFVSLVEEGWENHEVTEIIIKEYLTPLLAKKIDTLVLGCTHYPILKPAIRKIVGNEIALIDSAEALALQLQKLIPKQEIEQDGKDTFFVSDNEEKFRKIASHILGRNIQTLMNVKLGESWYIPL